MKLSSFLPRTRSKAIFVIVMASYGIAAGGLLRAMSGLLGLQRAPMGALLKAGHPILECVSVMVVAPLLESLILIGLIEWLRSFRAPTWLQIALPAILCSAAHRPLSHAIVVSPAWFIMAAAYLIWRRVSWTQAFIVIASIHALLNLTPTVITISYAIHHQPPPTRRGP